MFHKRFAALLTALALALCGAGVAEDAIRLSGEEIARLEEGLKRLGYLTPAADDMYDQDTRIALESYQQANGLPVTGTPDQATLDKLYNGESVSRQAYLQSFADAYRGMEPLKEGDINAQVQTLQRRLDELGYFSGGVDGVFGAATRAAVERFQMVSGLEVTGVADGMTMMRLMADVPITWQGFLSEMGATSGDAGLNVYTLQRRLGRMGYYDGDCNGSFSELTRQAVMAFQEANALEPTGIADVNTWALIYSGNAVTRKRADVVSQGDKGERVVQIRSRLAALGYFPHASEGSYDYATATAVRLFQMGNGLVVTGEVDPDTLELMLGNSARALDDSTVQKTFEAALNARDASVQAVISDVAGRLLGEAFVAEDDVLYPGFSLVQYVCVTAGLPVTQPEQLIALADRPVSAPEEVTPGNIVTLQSEDSEGVTILMAIGAGDGRVIYAKPDVGWVVMSYIDQMSSTGTYRWAEDAERTE